MIGIAITGVAVTGLVAWRLIAKRRLLSMLGAEFAKYNSAAYAKQLRPSDDERFYIVERLATELQSKAGQLAVSVEANGFALHHINKDGTFSQKGPYFVSRYTQNWRPTGRRHLVRCFLGKGSWGFESTNPGQGGGIRERGVAVLEYGTTRYPPVDIWDYAEIHRREAAKWKTIDP